MSVESTPPILYVDDDRWALTAIARALGQRYRLTTCTSAHEALSMLARMRYAVVLSDLRMPEMDGVALLAKVKESDPDIVRILITGSGDLDAAIAAINHGSIFRFLTKPCEMDVLRFTLDRALEQHRLVTSERELLDKTLTGIVAMLTDEIALARPAAYAQAMRVKRLVADLFEFVTATPTSMLMPMNERWAVEVAAVLSHLGAVVLPEEISIKKSEAKDVTGAEQAQIERMASISVRWLSHIPRLESVCEIIQHHNARFDEQATKGSKGSMIPWGARLLKVAFDFDSLDAQGLGSAEAIDALRKRPGHYDLDLLDAVRTFVTHKKQQRTLVKTVTLEKLATGMTFAEDVRTTDGRLLAARGLQVTPRMLEIIQVSWLPYVKLMGPLKIIQVESRDSE